MQIKAGSIQGQSIDSRSPHVGGSLSLSGLERVYDALAAAIDQAGPEKTESFLVKLALLNAHALGDAEQFDQHLRIALQDL